VPWRCEVQGPLGANVKQRPKDRVTPESVHCVVGDAIMSNRYYSMVSLTSDSG
jgi:hypothetical protein